MFAWIPSILHYYKMIFNFLKFKLQIIAVQQIRDISLLKTTCSKQMLKKTMKYHCSNKATKVQVLSPRIRI